jgi:hypothetical protein
VLVRECFHAVVGNEEGFVGFGCMVQRVEGLGLTGWVCLSASVFMRLLERRRVLWFWAYDSKGDYLGFRV